MKSIVLLSLLLFVSQSFSDVGQVWVSRYNGSANNADWAYAITMDQTGNIFVTGYSNGSGTGKDMRTIKYDPTGQVIWTASYNGPINGGDYSHAIVVDGAGNVYVTGRADFGATLSDLITIKYNSSGVQQWAARYNGPSNGEDEGKSLQVDASGNVFVGGKTFVNGQSYDFIAIKYNSSGTEQWVATYNGPGNNEDVVNSLAIDASGNVYLAGLSIGSGTGSDFTVVRFNADGTSGWTKRYNGTANGGDGAVSVKVDGAGNVFAAGFADMSFPEKYNFITVKYNNAGTQQWMASHNGNGGLIDDFATAMTIDASSNVYVTGASGGQSILGIDSNYATIKYNSNGQFQWMATYTGPSTSIDVSRAIFVDNSQNVYITGTSTGTTGSEDYVSIKYTPTGGTTWIMTYNGPSAQNDYSTSIVADNGGNAFVTGRSIGSGSNYDFATLKYGDMVGIDPISTQIPDRFNLYQNYPNPFNPSTKIKFDIPQSSEVALKVFDIKGAVVYNEHFGVLNASSYEYNFSPASLSSGVYFYELTAGTFKATKKMIMVK